MSRRIFELVRDQQEEVEMPEDEELPHEDDHESFKLRAKVTGDHDEESDDDDMSDNGDAEDMFVNAFWCAWLASHPPLAIGFWRYPSFGCTTAR